jgi:hypothetical protein
MVAQGYTAAKMVSHALELADGRALVSRNLNVSEFGTQLSSLNTYHRLKGLPVVIFCVSSFLRPIVFNHSGQFVHSSIYFRCLHAVLVLYIVLLRLLLSS